MSNEARTDPHSQPPFHDSAEAEDAENGNESESVTEPEPDYDRYEQL